MSLHKHDAPPSLVSLIWSVAGVIGLFFALAITSFFVLKTYYPVDAQSVIPLPQQGNCASNQSRIAINNYPGRTTVETVFKDDPNSDPNNLHKPVIDALGGAYQCSNICVQDIDRSKPFDDSANLAKIRSALEGATVDGKPLIFKETGTEFIQAVKDAKTADKLEELKRIAIIPYSKDMCKGHSQTIGGSVEYKNLVDKNGKPIKAERPNTTMDETKKKLEAEKAAREEEAKAAAEAGGPQSIVPPPKGGPEIAVAPPEGGGEGEITDDYKTKVNNCKIEINAINKKYNSETYSANTTISSKLKNLWLNFSTAIKNTTFTSNGPGYKKCLAYLEQYHQLINSLKASPFGDSELPLDSASASPLRDSERILFEGGGSMQRFINGRDYSDWTRKRGASWSAGGYKAYKIYDPWQKEIYATWVFYRDKSDNEKKKYFWSMEVKKQRYYYDPTTSGWWRYEPKQYGLITTDDHAPDYYPVPFIDGGLKN